MQFTTLTIAALACLTSSASAASAIVRNSCTFPVYVQSSPNGGGASTAVMTIPAGGTYSQAFAGSGSAIKLGTTSALRAPLTFEYTPSGATVYYDISNNAGNPFNANKVSLVSASSSCPQFHCAPNSGNSCYSNGSSIKVKACGSQFSLTTTLCG